LGVRASDKLGAKMEAHLSEYARQLQSLLLELDSPSERREKLAALLEGERVADVFEVSFLKSPKIFARGQRLESLEREIYPKGTTSSQDHQKILSTLLASTGADLMTKRYLFVSYARQDAGVVLPIVEAVRHEYRLRALDVDVWIDVEGLLPGQSWDAEITRVLRDSIGLLVFVSPAAMESDWVRGEITAAAVHHNRLIIPVILRHVPNLPLALSKWQWLDLSDRHKKSDLQRAAREIANATEAHLSAKRTTPPVAEEDAPTIAASIAQEARSVRQPDTGKEQPPDSVFLVHGHDNAALSEMEAYLTDLGVKSFILSRVGGSAQSLLQKFLKSATDARFAIVILSSDDFGASRIQYDANGVGDRALQFRARQNVILELGFFYGLLGWENVFVLFRSPDKVYPNFERPSNIDGAVFDSMDASGLWRESLAQKLREAGFRLTNNESERPTRGLKRTPVGAV
jgi:predicted nucleotide-binding protein